MDNDKARDIGGWLYGASSGFLWWNIPLWPVQMSVMIVLILIFLYGFGMNVWPTFILSYVITAIVITFVGKKWLEFVLDVTGH